MLRERLSAADPRDAWAQLSLADDYSNLADALSLTADRQEAIPALEKSLNMMNSLLTRDPKNVELQGVQSAALETAGDVYRRAGNDKVALSYYRKALDITAKIYADDPKNEDARLRLAADYNSVASALVGQRDTNHSIEAYEKALTLAGGSDAASPSEEALYVIANSYAGQGDAQMKLAEKERQSGRKLPLLQKACGLFEQSLKAWSAIREPGTMSPNGFYSVAPTAVAAQLKSCHSAVRDFEALLGTAFRSTFLSVLHDSFAHQPFKSSEALLELRFLEHPEVIAVSLRSSCAQETITDSCDGDDQFRMLGVLLQFFAETRHMHVDRAGQGIFRIPPDRPQEFAARQRTASALYEVAQELKLACRKIDWFSISRHYGTAYVHLNWSKLMNTVP